MLTLTVNQAYRTRGGERAKVLSLNAAPEFPVVVEIGEGTATRLIKLRKGGKMLVAGQHTDDLVGLYRTPIARTGLVNVYAEHNGLEKFNRVFLTRGGADKKARSGAGGDNRIGIAEVAIAETRFIPFV